MQENEKVLQLTYGKMAGIHWVNDACNQGMPMLALHGWLDNAMSFSPIAHSLIQVTPDFMAVDLPGHGRSDHREQGNHYHFVDYVFDVLECVAQLGWNRFVLIGHSMGAGIASLIAAVAPELVSHLILIDGIGPLSSHAGGVTDQLEKSIRSYQRMTPRLKQMTYPNWDALIKRRAKIGNINHKAAELLVKRNAKQDDGEIIWLADRRLNCLSPIYMAEQQVLSFLSRIEATTLLVKAKQGLLNQRATTLERITAVSKLEVVELSGGHHLHMENPEQVAAQVIRFLHSGRQSD
ncbi:MAG: alpha/beta hydrolase [Methylococcales bacterium]